MEASSRRAWPKNPCEPRPSPILNDSSPLPRSHNYRTGKPSEFGSISAKRVWDQEASAFLLWLGKLKISSSNWYIKLFRRRPRSGFFDPANCCVSGPGEKRGPASLRDRSILKSAKNPNDSKAVEYCRAVPAETQTDRILVGKETSGEG